MPTRIFPVILAGGASSRLWPASDRSKPKWDLRLFGSQSMLEGAWERARAVAPPSDCYVVAGDAQAELIRRSLPELPHSNLLIEPEPRDTSGAVAYAAGAILRLPGGAAGVMFVLPGDHVISPVDRFAECARTAAQAAVENNALVTFGIVPRKPATGYGYVQRGEAVVLEESTENAADVFHVRNFKEKPDLATAQQYVASGEYYWNGGIFLWQISSLMEELERQLPVHAAMARALGEAHTFAEWTQVAGAQFPGLKKISIDFGIMEHARSVLTVVADFFWDDIGSWSAVAEHLDKSTSNAVGPQTEVISIDSRSNVVLAPGKRVALVGVENLAVIESNGQILICRLDRDQDVKKVSEAVAKAKPQ